MTDESVVDSGTCPVCGEHTYPGDRFCEGCGNDLLLTTGGTPDDTAAPASTHACVQCGATGIDPDGFCTSCGFAQPAARDRVELDLGFVAGVSDRGLRHHRNEDAMALRVTTDPADPTRAEHVVAVVCDGVSTSDRPDDAAKAAADAAADLLLRSAREHGDPAESTRDAIGAALDAVIALTPTGLAGNAPACTIVSAVVADGAVTVGWVGDSRAYWVAAEQPGPELDGEPVEQVRPEAAEPGVAEPDAVEPAEPEIVGSLFEEHEIDESALGPAPSETEVSFCATVDDSWAQRMVASGQFTEAEAAADPRSHALVAWLGADAGTVLPHVRTFRPDRPGAVVVCSDGLWNYLSDAEKLASAALPNALEAPFTAAAELTALAISSGGHDNVTVVVVPFPHHGTPVSTPSTARSTQP
ncbi:MAG TPA: protein phosphatase 2C domain-containing protein [Pseudonocardiaceae bacterium]|nr:protein phosphatase 2C domain-containing protein [Pseudonocardiaceae bacterium]